MKYVIFFISLFLSVNASAKGSIDSCIYTIKGNRLIVAPSEPKKSCTFVIDTSVGWFPFLSYYGCLQQVAIMDKSKYFF